MVDQLVVLSVDWMVGLKEKTMAALSVAVMVDLLVVRKDVRSVVTTVVSMDMTSVGKQVVQWVAKLAGRWGIQMVGLKVVLMAVQLAGL